MESRENNLKTKPLGVDSFGNELKEEVLVKALKIAYEHMWGCEVDVKIKGEKKC